MAERTAAQKAKALKSPKNRGRSAAQKQAALDRYFALSGLGAANPGAGAPEHQSVGEQAWGGLKDVGGNVLDALSVPQAALFTVTAKLAGRDLSWKNLGGNFRRNAEGLGGGDAALNSLGVTDKWGRLGISLVADPLWFVGGTLVRAPTKIAATIKAAEEGADVAKGALQLTAGARALKAGKTGREWTYGTRTPRPGGATRRAEIGAGRKGLPAGDPPPTKIEKILADLKEPAPPTVRPMAVPGLPKSYKDRLVKAANVRRQPGPVQSRSVTIKLQGSQKPVKGELVNGRYFVAKTSEKANRGKYLVYDMGPKFNPNKTVGHFKTVKGKKVKLNPEVAGKAQATASNAVRVGGSFASRDEALGAATRAAEDSRWGGKPQHPAVREEPRSGAPARQKGDGKSGDGWTRREPDVVYDAEPDFLPVPYKGAAQDAAKRRNAEEVVDADWEEMGEAVETAADALRAQGKTYEADQLIDEFGNATDYPEMLKRLREYLTQHESREGMNYGIKFGAGKFSKTFDTGIDASRGLLGRRTKTAFKAGVLGMKPVEKVAHALRRSGSETSEGITAQVLRLADEFGMTSIENGKKVINESDATLLGVYRSLRQVNEAAGGALRDALQRSGLWRAEHDQVVAAIDKRNDYFKTVDNLGDDTREADLVSAIDKQAKKVKHFQKQLDLEDSRANANKLNKAQEKLANLEGDLAKLQARGPYTKQGRRQEDLDAERKLHDEAVLQGRATGGYYYRRYKDPEVRTGEREWLDNPFHAVTEEEFIADLQKVGLDEGMADSLAALVGAELEKAGLEGFRTSAFKHGLPEWNAFLLAGRREQDHIWHQVEEQIDELMRISGIGEDTGVGRLLKYGINREDPGAFSNTQFGQLLLKSVAKFKGFLTFANPSHYVRNLAGDFVNSNVNGNFRHLNPGGAGVTRSQTSRLANAEVWAAEGKVDDTALKTIHNIGGKEYTGQELLALSRMFGLGRGYVGTDIALMGEAFARARSKPGEFYKFMQRLNIKRENAQRMQTWMRHMQNGDDPITAATKTLRVHFDYTQLTEFERLALRNILLFYTWFKRNTLLQGSAVLTRPGFTATMGKLEESREKFPNEPDYYSKQLALPVPGLGSFVFGNPVGDLAKLELSMDGFRKDILGAVTPPIRVPLELATNTKFFSGGRIQDYEGQVEQNVFADLLGFGTPTTSKAGGEVGRGINPQLAYVLSQLTGPQGGTAQSLSNPDYEGSKNAELFGRFLGITPQQNRPEQFARAEKYKQAKKKADATRARNAQRGE